MKKLWEEIDAMMQKFDSAENDTENNDWQNVFAKVVDRIPQELYPVWYDTWAFVEMLHNLQSSFQL